MAQERLRIVYAAVIFIVNARQAMASLCRSWAQAEAIALLPVFCLGKPTIPSSFHSSHSFHE
jgi:hypothetical protein